MVRSCGGCVIDRRGEGRGRRGVWVGVVTRGLGTGLGKRGKERDEWVYRIFLMGLGKMTIGSAGSGMRGTRWCLRWEMRS